MLRTGLCRGFPAVFGCRRRRTSSQQVGAHLHGRSRQGALLVRAPQAGHMHQNAVDSDELAGRLGNAHLAHAMADQRWPKVAHGTTWQACFSK